MKLVEKTKKVGVEGPVVLIVMDGVGLNPNTEGNAVKLANTPTLDRLMANYPTLSIKAQQSLSLNPLKAKRCFRETVGIRSAKIAWIIHQPFTLSGSFPTGMCIPISII